MSEFVETNLSDLYIRNAVMVGISMFEESINHISVEGMSQSAMDATVELMGPLLVDLRKACLQSIVENEDDLIAHVKESTEKGLKGGENA